MKYIEVAKELADKTEDTRRKTFAELSHSMVRAAGILLRVEEVQAELSEVRHYIENRVGEYKMEHRGKNRVQGLRDSLQTRIDKLRDEKNVSGAVAACAAHRPAGRPF